MDNLLAVSRLYLSVFTLLVLVFLVCFAASVKIFNKSPHGALGGVPSLISLTVSVDVKHPVYLLTWAGLYRVSEAVSEVMMMLRCAACFELLFSPPSTPRPLPPPPPRPHAHPPPSGPRLALGHRERSKEMIPLLILK